MAPKIPTIIQCNSPSELDREIRPVRDGLAFEESEETWDKISHSILILTALARGGACEFKKEFVAVVKSLSRPLTHALNSERSRLSGYVIDFLGVLVPELGPSFEPLVPHFLPALLLLATRPNKLCVSRAKTCLLSIIEHTQLPTLFPYLRGAVNDKSTTLRMVATDAVLACMNTFNPPDLETTARAEDIEAVIRTTVRDASADVRKSSRKIFEAFKILLPNRVDAFVGPLTPVTKKYLDIKSKPAVIATSLSTSSSTQLVAMSSSTSAVPSSKSTLLTLGPQRPSAHGRSVSSSALKCGQAAEAVTIGKKSKSNKVAPEGQGIVRRDWEKRDMAPPVIIPSRPPLAVFQMAENSRGASSEMVSSTSSTSSIAASRPPSRPILIKASRSAQSTSKTIQKSLTSSDGAQEGEIGGARRTACHPTSSRTDLQEHNRTANKAIGGATRPHLPEQGTSSADVLHAKNHGPIRPLSGSDGSAQIKFELTGGKRVVGGARRVPRPVISQEQKAIEAAKVADLGDNARRERSRSKGPAKSIVTPAVVISHANSSNDPLPAESRGRQGKKDEENADLQRASSSTLTSQPHPPPVRSRTISTLSRPAQSAASTTSGVMKGADPGGFVPHRNASVVANGATAPTLSQLAKSKAPAKLANSGIMDAFKHGSKNGRPGRGRAAPALRPKESVKPLVPKKRAAEVGLQQNDTAKRHGESEIDPEDVPLPPSPITPTCVPLPESPKVHSDGDAETIVPISLGEVSEPVTVNNDNGVGIVDIDTLPFGLNRPVEGRDSESPTTPVARTNATSPPTPNHQRLEPTQVETPISSLLTSIRQGFLFTPDALGKVIESPRKKRSEGTRALGVTDRTVFADIN